MQGDIVMNETIEKFQELIERKEWKVLRDELAGLESISIAEIIEQLPEGEDIVVFRLLSKKLAKNTFQYLPYEKQEQVIKSLADHSDKLASLLNDLDPDDRTAFLKNCLARFHSGLFSFFHLKNVI